MKKYQVFFMPILAFVLLSVSCQKEVAAPAEKGETSLVPVTIKANYGTKTELGEGNIVLWKEYDEISVFDEYCEDYDSFITENFGPSADFVGEVFDPSVKFWAVYPYSKETIFDYNDGNPMLFLGVPSIQSPVLGSYDPQANISIATGLKNELSFKNICALLKITIAGNNVKSIKLAANSEDAKLVGPVMIEYSSDDTFVVTADESCDNTIWLCKSDYSAIEPGTYYLSVIPGTYVGGLNVAVYGDDLDPLMTKNSSADFTVQAGHIRYLGCVDGDTPTPQPTIDPHLDDNGWFLVKNADFLKTGDLIRIASWANNNVGAGKSEDGKYIYSIEASFSSDGEKMLSATGALDITLGKDDDDWTFTSKEGNIGCSSNDLTFDGVSTNNNWSIAIDASGNATITSKATDWKFKYNVTNPRFKTYAGNPTEQMPLPQIYKKYNGTGSDPDPDEPEYTHDVLTNADFTATSTAYTDFSNVKKNIAIYAGNSAKNNGIQLRSSNSNSGIVSTTSGGKIREIKVTWNSNCTSGRTIDVYGNDAAYSSAANLYDSETRGTKLGSVVNGTSTSVTVTGDYTYVGVRSNSGALNIDEIEFVWEKDGDSPEKTTPELSFADAKYTAVIGEAFTVPTLTNPQNVVVSYASSVESVATVNSATGAISLVAPGTTKITASFAGDESYSANLASYDLEVLPAPFANLVDLVETDLASGTLVTVSFENIPIKEIYTTEKGYRNGVIFDVQKAGNDIEIYFQNVPVAWVVGGKLSGTLTNCPWKLYNGTWELAPASGWSWSNLDYTAPVILSSPTITVQPVNATYELNASANNLSVTATGNPAPTYQWYSNTSKSNENGTVLVGQTSTSYKPSTTTAGIFYYYCVATNSEGSAASDVATITVKEPVVASLPFSFDGGKDDIAKKDGMSQTGLGTDYTSAPKLKFDSQGDNVVINFNESAKNVTYTIKGNSTSGTYAFDVLESADGTNYTTVHSHSDVAAEASYTDNLLATSRFVKFVYTKKDNGNIALGNIRITSSSVTYYTLTINSAENGSITATVDGQSVANGAQIEEGKTVTITATPASGYKVKSVSAKKTASGTALTVTDDNTFTMPAEAVTVSAEFEKSAGGTAQIATFTMKNSNQSSPVTVNGVTFSWTSANIVVGTNNASGFKANSNMTVTLPDGAILTKISKGNGNTWGSGAQIDVYAGTSSSGTKITTITKDTHEYAISSNNTGVTYYFANTSSKNAWINTLTIEYQY